LRGRERAPAGDRSRERRRTFVFPDDAFVRRDPIAAR
jgi:hypothetical protein